MSTLVRMAVRRPRGAWLRVFGAGLLLWLATVAVTLLTQNNNLIPSLVLLGSFLAPVTFVVWAVQRWRDGYITTEVVLRAFIVGGLLGVLGASVLETYLLHPSPWLFAGVGLIEESVKLGALVLVSRRIPRRRARDGVVLGAAVGFGFAAFETAGYAFNAVLTVQGISVMALVQTELLRSVIAPVGHGLWTAVLGGLLFGQVARGRHWYNWRLALAYLWISLLHALWDASHQVAVLLTYLATGTARQREQAWLGYLPSATPEQALLFTEISTAAMVAVGAFGLLTLWWVWRSTAGRPAPGGAPEPAPPGTLTAT